MMVLWTHADDIVFVSLIFLFGRHCFEHPPHITPHPGSDFYALPLPWGGLASKGLRLPSLKSDVHSTCWFFKQICPHTTTTTKTIRTSHSPAILGWIGGRKGRVGGLWSPSYQTLFLCLFLSHHCYLSLSSRFLNFFSWQFLNGAQKNPQSLQASHTLCMTCGGEGARSKLWVLHQIFQIQYCCSQ